MFIRVGGIPGVGKSTVIANIVKLANYSGLPIERVKGGDYLLKLANVSTYEELRALPEDYRASLRPKMYRQMYDDDRKTLSIIKLRDAHYSLVDLETGKVIIFPLLPDDVEQMLSMVLLKASPQIILDRRRLEVNRNDRYLNLDLIRREQYVEEETAAHQAASLGKELIIVDNSENNGFSVYREIISRAFPDRHMKNTLEGALARSISVGKEIK